MQPLPVGSSQSEGGQSSARQVLRDSISWLGAGLAIVLLGYVLWSRVIHPVTGKWHPEIVGERIGDPPLEDGVGTRVRVEHPAILYFFRMDCIPCAPAARLLGEYAARTIPGQRIYAITPDQLNSDSSRAPAPSPGITVARLVTGYPGFAFVRDVPLVVRTDAGGIVTSAYVGIPDRKVLDGMSSRASESRR